MAAARDKWLKTKNASEALKCLGHRPCNERHLLHGISKRHENDLVGALGFVSCISFIFNMKVSSQPNVDKSSFVCGVLETYTSRKT